MVSLGVSRKEDAGGAHHYEWLDFLRWLAAFVVVVTHVRQFIFDDYGSLAPDSHNLGVLFLFSITRLGHEAVIVFFVLSGYLVGGKALERMMAGQFVPRDYAIDRVSRIITPLVPALLLTALLANEPINMFWLLGNVFGLQGVLVPILGKNGPLWSLAYEVWFYVAVYAIGRVVTNKTVDLLSAILIALFLFVFSVLSVNYLICWGLGAAFYLWRQRVSSAPAALVALVACAVGTAGTQFLSAGSQKIVLFSGTFYPVFELLIALGTALFCVVLASVRGGRLSSIFPILASFSYTLYLTHYPVLAWLRDAGWSRMSSVSFYGLAVFFSASLGLVFIAWLIYLPFERNTAFVRAFIKGMGNKEGLHRAAP